MTKLTSAELTSLTHQTDGVLRGRLATAAKTADRLRKVLEERLGEPRGLLVFGSIMEADSIEMASARLTLSLEYGCDTVANEEAAPERAPTPEPQPAKDPRPAKARPVGKRQAILDQAQSGALPTPPDFSKPTHARFRAKLGQIMALAEAGDVAALEALKINPVSSSPKAMARYRDLCVIAINARAQVSG